MEIDASGMTTTLEEIEKYGITVSPPRTTPHGQVFRISCNSKPILLVGAIGVTTGYKQSQFAKTDITYGFNSNDNDILKIINRIYEDIETNVKGTMDSDADVVVDYPFVKTNPAGEPQAWIALRAPLPSRGHKPEYNVTDFEQKVSKLSLTTVSGRYKCQPLFRIDYAVLCNPKDKDGKKSNKLSIPNTLLAMKLDTVETPVYTFK